MSSTKEGADLVTVAIGESTRIHTELLAQALRHDDGLHVVTSASSSADLLAAVTRVPIDVAVISYKLDDQPARGTDVLREMRALRPHIKGIILLDSSRPQDVLNCFRAGAKGIFCKNERLDSLSKCIRTVRQGQIWARSADLDLALEALATAPVVRAINQEGMDLLSARERQVIQNLAAGMTNSEIADSLGLSRHTIKNYLFRIFDKLGVSNRTELLSLTMNCQMPPEKCTCGERERFSSVEQAAESGVVSAQLRLAEQFGQADGQPADPVAAYMWYLVAENNAQSFNERIEAGKQRLSQTISPHDRAEAERRAAAWVRKSRRPPSSVDFDETSKQLLTCAT